MSPCQCPRCQVRQNPTNIKVSTEPDDFPVSHWIIKIVGEPIPIGSFPSSKAAKLWAHEWLALNPMKQLILPVIDSRDAANAISEVMLRDQEEF